MLLLCISLFEKLLKEAKDRMWGLLAFQYSKDYKHIIINIKAIKRIQTFFILNLCLAIVNSTLRFTNQSNNLKQIHSSTLTFHKVKLSSIVAKNDQFYFIFKYNMIWQFEVNTNYKGIM